MMMMMTPVWSALIGAGLTALFPLYSIPQQQYFFSEAYLQFLKVVYFCSE
jgi:hypothetical protein